MEFFERCQSGLSPGGLICVKENITKTGVDMDSEDSSVTRYKNNVYETVFSNVWFALRQSGPWHQCLFGFPLSGFFPSMGC